MTTPTLPFLRSVRICLKTRFFGDLERLGSHVQKIFCGHVLVVGQSLNITSDLSGKVSALKQISSPKVTGAVSNSAAADDTVTMTGVVFNETNVSFEFPDPISDLLYCSSTTNSIAPRIMATILQTGAWMASRMEYGTATTLLLAGSHVGDRKAFLARQISQRSDVEVRHFISLAECKCMRSLQKLVSDIAQAKSACVVITNMELIVGEYLSDLLILFKKKPPATCKLFVVCTTNNKDLLSKLGIIFTKTLCVGDQCDDLSGRITHI